jgi:hypothetical protein
VGAAGASTAAGRAGTVAAAAGAEGAGSRGAGSDGGFVPGERAEFRGHLLRTYRVRFELNQPASGVRQDLGPVDSGELETGALAVGRNDVSFFAPLPTRLLPGPAYADPKAVDARVTVRQGEAACPFPLSLEILGPEVHEIDPDSGRVCPASDDCSTLGQGRACLEGERLGLDAWGDPEIRIGTLTVPPDEITQISERRVCFDVPESLHGTSLGSEVRVKLRYRTAALPGIDVPCIGGDCVRDSGTGSCDGSVPCHLPFVVTGRKDGPFKFFLDSPAGMIEGPDSETCDATTADGRRVTVTANVSAPDASGRYPYTVSVPGRTLLRGSFKRLSGHEGLRYNRKGHPGAGCWGVAILSYEGPDPDEYRWCACYLGNNLNRDAICVGCSGTIRIPGGGWERTFAGFSPDGSVMVYSAPDQTRPSTHMALGLRNMCANLDSRGNCYGEELLGGSPWRYAPVGDSPSATILANRMTSILFGGHEFVSVPILVPTPDPNEP